MTLADFEALCRADTRGHIEHNIERAHTDVALDKCLSADGAAALVAAQVKYLQRSRKKLPSYYDARCIVVGKAYEQSSSEEVAGAKLLGGGALLDLTCGLGVDSFILSKRFDSVVTVERDELFAEVARENFRRLGAENIEVVNNSAAAFLEACVAQSRRFDVVYCDPDRRGSDGRKMVVLEDCSPNIVDLRDVIAKVTDRLVVKCSPLFDVDEAFRIFGVERTAVQVVSSGDECKEVVVYVDLGGVGSEGGMEHLGEIGATAVGQGSVWRGVDSGFKGDLSDFRALEYKYLVIPDVALQKSRLARRVFGEIDGVDIFSDNGYGFALEELGERSGILGRVLPIERIERYEPKRVKRILKEMGISRAEILKREFPYSVDQAAKQFGIKVGGERKIAVTKVLDELYVVILK